MDSILSRIIELQKNRGIQQKQLCELLGINNSVFTDWKSGKCKSYTKYLYQIASILGTTPEYLRGEAEAPTNSISVSGDVGGDLNFSDVRVGCSSAPSLPDGAEDLIRIYSSLSAIDRAKLLVYASDLVGK